MRVADWIGQRLKNECDVIFGVTGGCIVNAVDGFYKQGLRVIPMHHEQSAAMAADGYARMSGRLGLCYATSGPGGQNLVTGIACAYYDSVPILAIIGQVPSGHYNMTCNISGLRQFGFQESHNADIARPVSKFAVNVSDISLIRTIFETAIYTAKTERCGPSVIDLCDDIQRKEMTEWVDDRAVEAAFRSYADQKLDNECSRVVFGTSLSSALHASKRAVIILGSGVMQSGCADKIEDFVSRVGAPVLLSWGAKELLDESNPYYIGGFGIAAERAGNYALKHADLIVSIGCRLDTHGFGSSYKWLEGKKIIVVDMDKAELDKLPNVDKYHMNIRDAIKADIQSPRYHDWTQRILAVRRRFPICGEIKSYSNGWDPYSFIKLFSDSTKYDAIVVGDAGQTLSWLFQVWETKKGQRLFSDFNNSCMGYSLPASIGAAFACPNRPVYCVMGDGSFMMNIQELQTIRQHNLNVKVVIINNGGYGMIMQTQSDWPSLSQGISCNVDGGLTFPDYEKIAHAFDLPYMRPESRRDIEIMAANRGPMIVDAKIIYGSKIAPKLLWGDDLWNQKPYLSDEEKQWIDKVLIGG